MPTNLALTLSVRRRSLFTRLTAASLAAIALLGCAADATESTRDDGSDLLCRTCGGGGDPLPKPIPKPPPPKPVPPPQPIEKDIPSGVFDSALRLALGGLVVQVSQVQDYAESISEPATSCTATITPAERQCWDDCMNDDQADPNCHKNCSSLGGYTCVGVCGTYADESFIRFPAGLVQAAGAQACNLADCQTCDASGMEPALWDRGLTGIPYPIFSKSGGSCIVTKMRWDVDPNAMNVTFDLGGIHLGIVADQVASPALSCSGGVPDMDLGSPTVTIDVVPYASGGTVYASVLGHFAANVSAHDPLGNITLWAADAQSLVNSHATTAINNQAQKLAVPLGKGLNQIVKNQLPAGAKLDHTAFGQLASGGWGILAYYFP